MRSFALSAIFGLTGSPYIKIPCGFPERYQNRMFCPILNKKEGLLIGKNKIANFILGLKPMIV